MLHIYCGDGKGKTTAAIGLAARMAGAGGRVLIVQFLKGSKSGEIDFLAGAENVDILRCDRNYGFTFQMKDSDKAEITRCHNANLKAAIDGIDKYNMIVLDEIFAAISCGLVDEDAAESLAEKAEQTELIMTGRNPGRYYIERADYVSYIKKVKHPFDNGVTARKGIEF